MSHYTVNFPRTNTLKTLSKFTLSVAEAPVTDELRFKTGHVSFFTPTSMTMIAKTCRSRSRCYSKEKLLYSGLDKHGYANNMGFSEALNIKGNPYPQGAYGGQNYYPISAMRRDELEGLAEQRSIAIGDAIQIRCEEIAKVVSQKRSQELQTIIANSFREIFRNTFEHSGANGALFCAQYWPQKDEVEICISDRGKGIFESLKENKYLTPSSTYQALALSLMPGVSSKAWRHKKKRSSQKSEWDNSGYGLFFAHKLFGELGWFYLASGDKAILIESGEAIKQMDCAVEGTVVSMRLDLSDADKIEKCIKNIKNEAHRVKHRIGTKSIDFKSVEAFLRKEKVF